MERLQLLPKFILHGTKLSIHKLFHCFKFIVETRMRLKDKNLQLPVLPNNNSGEGNPRNIESERVKSVAPTNQTKPLALEGIIAELLSRDYNTGIPRSLLQKIGVQDTVVVDGIELDEIDGLIQGLTLEEMKRVLKAQEKYLVLQLIKQEWNAVRPPSKNWYQIKNKTFSHELRRNGSLLNSKSKYH